MKINFYYSALWPQMRIRSGFAKKKSSNKDLTVNLIEQSAINHITSFMLLRQEIM